MLVSDRLKSCLPPGPLNYVLSLEGNDWYTPDKVASLSDTFVNNHQHPSAMRGKESGRGSYGMNNGRGNTVSGSGYHPMEQWTNGSGGGQPPTNKHCYRCNFFTHLARFCPRGRGRGFNTFNNRGRGNADHVSFCSTIESRTTFDEGVSNAPISCKYDPWEFAEFPTFEGADVIM